MSAEEQAAALACMSPGDRAAALVSVGEGEGGRLFGVKDR